MVNVKMSEEEHTSNRMGLRRKKSLPSYYTMLNECNVDNSNKQQIPSRINLKTENKVLNKTEIKKEPVNFDVAHSFQIISSENSINSSETVPKNGQFHAPETYLIDRYKYAVRHIKQGLSVEEACNKYRISKGALLKCLSGGTAPRGKKTRLTESEENEIVEWLINYKDLKYNEAIHLVFEQVAQKFELAQRPNPFNNGKPSMDWWYDFLSRHPQIMASKPDWIMRGKVNDQYIRDVQSGHLKCTKFRRALLSAIQYISSLNEKINSLENNFGDLIDIENSCKKNEMKINNSDHFKNDSNNCKKFRSSTNKQSIKSSSKSDDSLNGKNLKFKDSHTLGHDNLNNAEINDDENNETNIDNATFITEIFNPELELDNKDNFDDLIDQNLLMANGFKEECSYENPIYDMDYMLSDHFRLDNYDSKRTDLTNGSVNSSLNSDSSFLDTKSSFHIDSQHRYYQHLLVTDDDEDY